MYLSLITLLVRLPRKKGSKKKGKKQEVPEPEPMPDATPDVEEDVIDDPDMFDGLLQMRMVWSMLFNQNDSDGDSTADGLRIDYTTLELSLTYLAP